MLLADLICGACFFGSAFLFLSALFLSSAGGAPLGNAVIAGPETRAAIAKGWPAGTIAFISCPGCCMRTCMASSSEALLEDEISGVKVVVAPFACDSAPTLAR